MIREIFRWFGVLGAYPVFKVFFKTKVFYEDETSQSKRIDGGALIITNHYNLLDFFVNMFYMMPRKLYVVASEYAFRNKWITFGMSFFGGIQANRISRDMSFVDESVRLIKKGKLVQIFPEARNTTDGKIHDFKPSYLIIAHRAKAPIVPIVTDGNYGWSKKAHILVGKKIYLSDYCDSETLSKEDIIKLNEIVRNKVLSLKEELESRIDK